MGFRAFNYGANVVAYDYKGHKMAMTCAWAMQVDYQELCLCLGSQSDTGNHLKIGDRVGVSALSHGQEKIALQFGEGHSLEGDKFHEVQYENDHGILTILGAKVRMKCTVENILNHNGDHLVFLRVDSYDVDPNKGFLSYDEVA